MSTGKPLLATFTIVVLIAGAGRAQQPAHIEPEAMSALHTMGAYLRSLKSFQVEAVTSTEDVLEDGQKVQFAGVTNVLARMPNRLRITVASDRRDRVFVYDGKEFTLLAKRVNYYATVPAPPTIGELADMVNEKFDLELPLEDLFRWKYVATFTWNLGPSFNDATFTFKPPTGASKVVLAGVK